MAARELTRFNVTPSLFENFFRPWNEWFDDSGLISRVQTMPAVNIMENDKYYEVALAVPGYQKDDFKINLDGNTLTIGSEKEETKEDKDERYTRREYSYSSFSRSFNLPEDVKQDTIEARYENGVLKIRLPRKEDAGKTPATKRIAVQ